jgi:hypothetical protein
MEEWNNGIMWRNPLDPALFLNTSIHQSIIP